MTHRLPAKQTKRVQQRASCRPRRSPSAPNTSCPAIMPRMAAEETKLSSAVDSDGYCLAMILRARPTLTFEGWRCGGGNGRRLRAWGGGGTDRAASVCFGVAEVYKYQHRTLLVLCFRKVDANRQISKLSLAISDVEPTGLAFQQPPPYVRQAARRAEAAKVRNAEQFSVFPITKEQIDSSERADWQEQERANSPHCS